jgi:uncharacterized damage-inducible protein DinB
MADKDSSSFFLDRDAITNAMGEAVQDALRKHKLLGQSIVTWRDGKVVTVPPEEIELNGEEVYVVRWKVPDQPPARVVLDEAARDAMLRDYLTGPAALRRAVEGMTREQLAARPIPGRWSTLDVVCHLADFEGIYAERVKRALAEKRPPLFAADRAQLMAALAYPEREVDEELAFIDAVRGQIARILKAQSPDTLSRFGIHTKDGPVAVQQILAGAVEHLQHHLPFIREKRQALGLSGEPTAG